MSADQIKFNDGSAYERYMGIWSRLAGDAFLDWLALKPGLRWLDVGCGNGAFTERIIHRFAPKAIEGIDPSEEQLAFARKRLPMSLAQFKQGDAMALPYSEKTFDVAVMPLVIFFVPEPAQGVAEMKRVVSEGGRVTAYSWDMQGGGFPYVILHRELEAMGIKVPVAPNGHASRIDVLKELWSGAGLKAVETLEIKVERTFQDFEEYWTTILGGPSSGGILKAMGPKEIEDLKARLLSVLPISANGSITLSARANAIQGTVR